MRPGCQRKPMRSAGMLVFLAFVLVTTVANAQLAYPWNVGCSRPILDEFGVPLQGVPGQGGDLIEILIASNGVIQAPAADGTPAAGHSVFHASTIGNLVSPSLADAGLFSISLYTPPRSSDMLFIRVFNAPTREAASFYADSQLGQAAGEIFTAVMGAMQPLDPADDDHDGLNNSWEKSLGSDPGLTDTDGDGMSDAAEFKARTDLNDPDSNLRIAGVRFDPDGNAVVSWRAAPQVSYQLEVAPGGISQGPLFAGVGQVLTASNSWVDVTVPAQNFGEEGLFRLKLAE